MTQSGHGAIFFAVLKKKYFWHSGIACVLAAGIAAQAQRPAQSAQEDTSCESSVAASPFIPVDSWIYPAVLRLYGLGYVDSAFLGLRPWTRVNLGHFIDEANVGLAGATDGTATDEAQRIVAALRGEWLSEASGCGEKHGQARVESVYSVVRGISGTPLRDSFHLGSTFVNDYGRPYENGANNFTGASGYATSGRFTVYLRGEFEGAPSAAGYSRALGQTLSGYDQTTFLNPITGLPNYQATIPLGPIGTVTQGRIQEAYVSAQVLNHVISFGKQDEWMGPGEGGAMAYSNNAEGIYAFHINRVEPLMIPFLSRLTGPFRYEFLVGPTKGHNEPLDPWVHVEKLSFRPTPNLEFGFERTAIWGGKGHTPITLHSFLKSFFSTSAPQQDEKNSRNDPGARFGAFDFSYRLPFARHWLTLYTDSEVHDDMSPIDAPRRASWHPGLYLSQVPGLPKLDLRVEAAYTDPPITNSNSGQFMYWEYVEKQGYTNNGQLFGDWVGREDKGGQLWATYHLSGNEWIKADWRHQKAAKDFISGGTTLNDVDFQLVKRLGHDFEINGNFKLEHWKAPIYKTGLQTVTATTVQLTWYPKRKTTF
jgi:hypothetical protein